MGVHVVELFAGVGGFRDGLEKTNEPFVVKWFNQWEPATKVQHAYDCYVSHYHPKGAAPEYSNHDVLDVTANHMDAVPQHDLLVGGFPCQDYSVATTLDKSGGLDGKKGRLWWAIDDILRERRPKYVLLENVNTLLTKPSNQRGRSFGVILSCLNHLGYNVEWRVINAAEYGNAQRRRRIFIFAARQDTGIGQHMASHAATDSYLVANGFFASRFPVAFTKADASEQKPSGTVPDDPRVASREFTARFQNSGVLVDGQYWTRRVDAAGGEGKPIIDILEKDGVDEQFYIDESKLDKWEYQKGPKAEPRKSRSGHEYVFKEGGMQFPDLHESPSRTILTSEANRTPNRSTHVVEDPKTGKLRFLTPLECERLNGFDDNWTATLPRRWRYFTMGNALVVDLVTDMGNQLAAWIREHEDGDTLEALLEHRETVQH